MARDNAESGVEFVDDESTGEQLPDHVPPPARPLRRTLAGAALVLIAGALIVRGITDRHAPPAASATSSTSSIPRSAPSQPLPLSVEPLVPGGPIETRRDCPAQDVCSVMSGLPDIAMESLRRVFPAFVLRSSTTVLVQRPGRFEPDLADRSVAATAGSDSIAVHIRKSGGRADHGRRRDGAGRTTTYVTTVVPGFTVSIAVSQPAADAIVTVAALIGLASDAGLLSPQ